MSSFWFPIRVAAGLAAVTVEQTRRLPSTLLGLPVTVVSQALQVSMRVQQQMTELAIKGDETLGQLRGYEEQPVWATFDEDEPEPAGADVPDADEPPAGPVVNLTEPAALGDDLAVLPEYDQMTVPQLRGKLRGLSEAELVVLLEHEQAHGQRPEFVRMLSNRLERLRQ